MNPNYFILLALLPILLEGTRLHIGVLITPLLLLGNLG